jgi:hypothetical protein
MWLRQSTASQEILLGPFLDSTDGDTAETGLTIANTDIKLWKEGATTEANKNSGGATHIASGRYYAVLDATDTNTLGKLEVNVHVAGALAVRREYMVLPANVYDSLVLGTDTLDTNVTQWLGTAPATPTTAGVPEVDVTHVSGEAEDIATATALSTAQTDLDTLTGTDGVTLASSQPNSLTFADITISVADGVNNVTFAGSGAADVFAYTRSGSGDLYDAAYSTALQAQVNAACDTALTDYDPPTKAELDAGFAALNDPTAAAIATEILTTQMTESYAADGTAPTLAQALCLIQQSIGDFSISGTTLTVKKLDGSTTAATYTLDDAVNPTSRTRAT